MLTRGVGALLVSALSGALLVLAFAPFNIWLLAPLCLAVLFYLVAQASPKAAFLRGLVFGLGLYLAGVSWVYVSLSTYGGMPLWMGIIAVVGFAALLSLFIAIPVYLAAKFVPNGHTTRLLILPFAWVVFEWMKSWVLTGFPWMDLGYTQTSTPLFALAPVGGVNMVSLAVAAIAALLSHVIMTRRWYSLAVVPVVLGASWLLERVTWTEAAGESIRIGIVQANVPINDKWKFDRRQALIAGYHDLSQSLVQQDGVDLVVWPETALPLHLQQTDGRFWQSIKPANSALLTGIVDTPSLLNADPDYSESYNAAVLACDGENKVYRKRHLVPFGEYMPLRWLFGWVLDYLNLPMSDFSYAQGIQSMHCGDKIKVGLSICYEDAFADEYRRHLGDATILVNISEDAWFGDSFAPHQRLQMAQMRAREMARPMVRSANSGPSVFIDERGQILTSTAQFKIATISHELVPQTGKTPFVRFGSWIVYFSLLVVTIVIVSYRRTS